jgi:hypothetical protein
MNSSRKKSIQFFVPTILKKRWVAITQPDTSILRDPSFSVSFIRQLNKEMDEILAEAEL